NPASELGPPPPADSSSGAEYHPARSTTNAMTRDLRTRSPFGVKRTAPPAWRATTVGAAGVQLAVFEAGSTSPGAPAVVLLHGLGHWSDAAWSKLVPQLDPSCRYVAFDLPGFGASEKPDAR